MEPAMMAGHLRSVTLGVPDIAAALDFYTRVWGLDLAGHADDAALLRGQGREHHVVVLRARPGLAAGLLQIEFASPSAEALGVAVLRAERFGIRVIQPPRARADGWGGGVDIVLEGVDGVDIALSAGVAPHDSVGTDATKPLNVTHVVLNSTAFEKHRLLLVDVLDLKVSDRTRHMEFLRSSDDHHSVALAHGDNNRLNHIAFEMSGLDAQMYGAGRVIEAGYALEWGPGRHGPGNNVFCYFIDPHGLAIEYTSEIEQIPAHDHVPGSADEWERFPRRPCRWGIARQPSARLRQAFAGEIHPHRDPA